MTAEINGGCSVAWQMATNLKVKMVKLSEDWWARKVTLAL